VQLDDVHLAARERRLIRVQPDLRETAVAGDQLDPAGPAVERERAEHRLRNGDECQRTAYQGDDERVFCSQTGGPLDPRRYAETLRFALARAKVEGRVRPFHDGRHTSITNWAAGGMGPAAMMARAGHSDFKTTQGYIDLAGETFREEARLADARLFGQKLGQK
jgi:integrase